MKKITKEKLEKMYKTLSNEEVCKKLEISAPTLIRLLKENNIELKGAAGRVRKIRVIS